MVGPIGIPDLTALVGAADRLEARLALGVPPLLNEIDAAIVAVASSNSMPLADVAGEGSILGRCPHAERAVASPAVVEDLEVLEHSVGEVAG
jgi:hypothetical protein